MKSSPIYNLISNPGRTSDCSFGSSEGFTQDIRVGTSRTNSHSLANISVNRFQQDDGTVLFQLFLDGTMVKSGILDGKTFDLK